MRWTLGFVLLLVLSVIVLAMPARFEGPILVSITQRHGVTLSDVVGFVPLSVGWLAWLFGIWRRRWRLEAMISASPRAATVGAFVGGLGAGLLIASARTSSWWLVLGAALLMSVALGAVPIAARDDQPAGEEPRG
jgi:MFS family permease